MDQVSAVTGRIIKSEACIEEGTQALLQLDARFVPVLELSGPLPLRLKPDGFSALLNAIVGQQISLASAAAVWARLQTAGLTEPTAILNASDDALRDCGLSRPKLRYARALAAAKLDYVTLRTLPDDQVISTLIEIPGIGPWTAEIYAMFSLGRADVFAPGDLALQEAARLLFALNDRPTEKMFRQLAEIWSPWRSVAARALWAYYRVMKNREGIQ